MSSKIDRSTWTNLCIFVVLSVIYFPLGLGYVIYKLYKRFKKNTSVHASQNHKVFDLAPETNNSLVSQFLIPEPTRSLLWITEKDTSKISPVHKMTINISVNIESGDIKSESVDESYNFYSEPSLIWSRLPVEKNNELETKKMYYPTYPGLSPKHRYQYLNWLRDVTQETNLSYVFLYYYGLERQLLVGNYDLAVDEILRLIKHHDKGSFKEYATNALVLGSGYRKRPDIIKKAPFILNEPSDVSIYLQRLAKDSLSAEEVIKLSNRVGFTNKRYIQRYSETFTKILQNIINVYQERNGDLLQMIEIDKLPKSSWASMANTSIPDDIRISKFPNLLDGSILKYTLKKLLQETHLRVKDAKKNKLSVQPA
jgi:hypothetical protein